MTLGTSVRGPLLPLLVVSLAFFSSNSTTTLQGKRPADRLVDSGRGQIGHVASGAGAFIGRGA